MSGYSNVVTVEAAEMLLKLKDRILNANRQYLEGAITQDELETAVIFALTQAYIGKTDSE